MGDPAGIGPEVVIKALADRGIRKLARFVIYGLNELLTYEADRQEIDPFWFRVQHDSDPQEQCELREHHDAAANEREPAFAQISARQQSLHEELIDPVRRHRQERAAHEARPEGEGQTRIHGP